MVTQKIVVMANAHEGLSPVYRFFNTQTGIHLYTISEYERDYILANLPHYSYEGTKFYVYSPGIHPQETTAVYRFFNTRDGGHLYTISEFERDYIMDNLQHYNYEGIKFYVYTKPEFPQPEGNVSM